MSLRFPQRSLVQSAATPPTTDARQDDSGPLSREAGTMSGRREQCRNSSPESFPVGGWPSSATCSSPSICETTYMFQYEAALHTVVVSKSFSRKKPHGPKGPCFLSKRRAWHLVRTAFTFWRALRRLYTPRILNAFPIPGAFCREILFASFVKKVGTETRHSGGSFCSHKLLMPLPAGDCDGLFPAQPRMP